MQNFYSMDFNLTIADKIQFYPEQLLRNKGLQQKGLKVVKYFLNKKYIANKSKNQSFYDIAILQIEKNQIIKKDQILKVNFNYNFEQNKNKLINISGYPGDIQLLKSKQLFVEKVAYQDHDCFLCYKHTTKNGNVGSPALLKLSQNHYEIIGIHKKSEGSINYCVLLGSILDNNQQLFDCVKENSCNQLWKEFYVSTCKNPQLREGQRNQQSKQKELKKQNLIEQFQKMLNLRQIKVKLLEDQLADKQKQFYIQIETKNAQIKSFDNQTQVLKSQNQVQTQELNQLQQELLKFKIITKSSIIKSCEDITKIFIFFNKQIKNFNLLFKASQNDFNLKKYWQKFGKQTFLLIICKTNKDKIIGAYSPVSRNYSKTQQINYNGSQYIKDASKTSFLFSLTQNDKFQLINQQLAVKKYINYMSFGNGELLIAEKSNTQKACQSNINNHFGAGYYNPKYLNWLDKQSCRKFNGNDDKFFTTKEWQVWKVEMKE